MRRFAMFLLLACCVPVVIRGVAPRRQARASEAQPAGDGTNQSAAPDPAPGDPTSAGDAGKGALADTPAAADTRPVEDPDAALRGKLRQVLEYFESRPLNTRDHNSWEVMHRIVAYGTECEIRKSGPEGDFVNAIGWLCYGGRCRGQRLVSAEGKYLIAAQGVGVQGHPGQFLAILAQSRVRADYAIQLDGKPFTLADLIEAEKRNCRKGMELTFELISLSHYLDTDALWKNSAGEEWSIPQLIQEEIKAPILRSAPCGGTHRLMGLAYAVRKRHKEGKTVDGHYLRAEKYLNEYHQYTLALQNADGSFSTQWFRGREARTDLDRRLQTTGHMLEWLVYSVPESMLRDERIVKSVDYLADLLRAHLDRDWELGPLGHGLHALAIYEERALQPAVPNEPDAASP